MESGLTTATIRATTETVDLLVLYKSDYDSIMNEYKQTERVEALRLLRSVPMFKNWARSRLDRVVQLLHRKRVKAGTVIIKQGDPPDNVYFVFEGRCVVMMDLKIKSSNRWPSGPKSWTTKVRQTVQPFIQEFRAR